MTYQGLTAEICQEAWEISRAAIGAASRNSTINKHAGTLIVLDPSSADADVLFRGRVDDNHPKAAKYDELALAKAMVSWGTGLLSRTVQQDAPHLLRPGMTKWGGAVVESGLVVSFSGVQAVYDEATAWMELKWIVAICQNEMTMPGGVMESDDSYILPDQHMDLVKKPSLSYGAILDIAGSNAEQRMVREAGLDSSSSERGHSTISRGRITETD
jgi:hypothetical protein